jgi:hypothetical protein
MSLSLRPDPTGSTIFVADRSGWRVALLAGALVAVALTTLELTGVLGPGRAWLASHVQQVVAGLTVSFLVLAFLRMLDFLNHQLLREAGQAALINRYLLDRGRALEREQGPGSRSSLVSNHSLPGSAPPV